MNPNTRKLIELHEGRVPSVYQDSLGYWTIGVGHLVDKRLKGGLPDHIIDLLLDYDIETHSAELLKVLPWAASLSEVRQAVLFDMTFNLGIEPFDGDGFKDWPMFVSQVKEGAYDVAALNMLSTLWAKQVGPRAVRLAAMMKDDKWPSDLK